MTTELATIQPDNLDERLMERAGALIASGALVAFPTETVYGLGGNALDAEASGKIYAAKGRPSDNPLIVHIAEAEELALVAQEVPDHARRLASVFWPGPLTMILRRNERVPYSTTGGLDTVAVRMPNHPVALELIRRSGCPVAAPSANRSGRPSPTEAAHVWEDLEGRIPLILDGGPVEIGIESTIVDLTGEQPMILRPGAITPEMLREVLGQEVMIDPGILAADAAVRPKAPGMKYRHYAPRAEMMIVEGAEENVTAEINRLAAEHSRQGERTAVLCSEETKNRYTADVVLGVGSRGDERMIAHMLYRVLRECDALEVSVIYSEAFSKSQLGDAIMNRLLKAAGHKVISV